MDCEPKTPFVTSSETWIKCGPCEFYVKKGSFEQHYLNLHLKNDGASSSSPKTRQAGDKALPKQEVVPLDPKDFLFIKPCVVELKRIESSSEGTYAEDNTRPQKRKLSYDCPKCDKVFKTEERLISHMVIHSNTRNYECIQCSKRFFFLSGLQKHAIKKHGVVTQLQTQEEPAQVSESESGRGEQLTTKKKKGDFKCKICGKTFELMKALKKHERQHDEEKEKDVEKENDDDGEESEDDTPKPFKCIKCGKGYSSEFLLKAHSMSH